MCAVCGKPLRRQGVLLVDAPGTVPQAGPGKCSTCYQRERREAARSPKPKPAFVTAATTEDMLTVARMVSSRFPDEPELLAMLGVAA